MKIYRDKLDILTSQYIKLRDKVCQRCGGTSGLQSSHYWGRAKRSTRYDSDNLCLLCFGCHTYFHGQPGEYRDFMMKRLGEVAYDMLDYRAHKPQKIDRNAIELYLKQKIKELSE